MPYLAGILSVIVILLISSVLFFTGPIRIKKISSFNLNLLSKTIILNDDLMHINMKTGKVIYYTSLKMPLKPQRIRLVMALNRLKAYVAKTDMQ